MRCCFGRSDPLKDSPSNVQTTDEVEMTCSSLSGCGLEDFDVGRTIGTGTYSRVYIVRHKRSKRIFAMKTIFKSEAVRMRLANAVLSEKDICFTYSHPFIAGLYTTFQCDRGLYFVFEFVPGGELGVLIKRNGTLKESMACFYASCVVLALDFLHSNSIIYRDLKPENLLVDSDGYVKLVDLGLAKKLPSQDARTYSHVGVPYCMAPEMVRNDGTARFSYGLGVDFWALGVLIFEMLTGDLPFKGGTDFEIFENIARGRYEMPTIISKDAKGLIKELFDPDAENRVRTGRKLEKHPWFKSVVFPKILAKEVNPPFMPPALAGIQKFGNHIMLNAADISAINGVAVNFDTYPEEDFETPISEEEDAAFASFGPKRLCSQPRPWNSNADQQQQQQRSIQMPSAESRRKSLRTSLGVSTPSAAAATPSPTTSATSSISSASTVVVAAANGDNKKKEEEEEEKRKAASHQEEKKEMKEKLLSSSADEGEEEQQGKQQQNIPVQIQQKQQPQKLADEEDEDDVPPPPPPPPPADSDDPPPPPPPEDAD